MMGPIGSYALITPCRNEAKYARRVLNSVAAQTVRPAVWVIVDDGSTDQTPQILAEYSKRYDFIQVVHREDRGERSVGPGVVDAFYAGFETIRQADFDYFCKLDFDVELPQRYFEILLDRMERNPRIATCSGKPYFLDRRTGKLISEKCGDEMSVGMTKFYRLKCFQRIDGFVRGVMWDGIDCHQCRMHGWIACSWDDAELRFVHLRPMGSSDGGWWKGRVRHGAGQYFMGTDLAYMTASALYRMTRPPLIVGGVAMWCGYVKSLLGRKPRYENAEFRRFLRRYQWACLLRGKKRSTQRLNERQAVKWQPLPNTVAGNQADAG